MLLIALLACNLPFEQGVAPSDPAASVQPPPPPAVYVLSGRATPAGLELPALSAAAPLVADRCAVLREMMESPSGEACFVEEWSSGVHRIYLHRAGVHLAFSAKLHELGPIRPATWTSVGAVLRACIGDVLALPPAGDPGATRRLTPSLVILHFSGQNLCHLEGELSLYRDADRADAAIRVDGMVWGKGGREQAQILLRSELRRVVAEEWPRLSPADQALAREVLNDDPAAQELLRSLPPAVSEGSP